MGSDTYSCAVVNRNANINVVILDGNKNISGKGEGENCLFLIVCHLYSVLDALTIYKLHKITSTKLLPFQKAKKWP